MVNKHLVIKPKRPEMPLISFGSRNVLLHCCVWRYLLLGSVFLLVLFLDNMYFWGYLCNNIFFKFFLTFSLLWRRNQWWFCIVGYFLIIQAVIQQWHIYIDLCFFPILVFWSGRYAALIASFFFFPLVSQDDKHVPRKWICWGGRNSFREEGTHLANCTIQGFKWYPEGDHLSHMGEHFVF